LPLLQPGTAMKYFDHRFQAG